MAKANGGNADLKNQLQHSANGNQIDPAMAQQKDVRQLLKRYELEISKALPKMFTPERFMRTIFNSLRTTPKLYECDPMSLIAAVLMSAQMGLEPGPLGHAYILPYWNNKTKTFQAQFQIGYRGMLDMVRRSGEVSTITANEVYEKDEFEAEYGSNSRLVHRPFYDGGRGELKRFYAYARTKDGGEYFYVASVSDMLKFRDKFASTRDRQTKEVYGTWVEHFIPMSLKTCLKQMTKYMPLNIEIQTLLAQDEAIKAEIAPDMTGVIDLAPDQYEEVQNDAGTAASESAATSESDASTDGQQESNLGI